MSYKYKCILSLLPSCPKLFYWIFIFWNDMGCLLYHILNYHIASSISGHAIRYLSIHTLVIFFHFMFQYLMELISTHPLVFFRYCLSYSCLLFPPMNFKINLLMEKNFFPLRVFLQITVRNSKILLKKTDTFMMFSSNPKI